MGKYDSERYDPNVGYCGIKIIKLKFDGSYLSMKANYHYSYAARSGKLYEKKKNGKVEYTYFKYDKATQKISGKGPIPEGKYWINPSELWENAWYKPGPYDSWGNFRITIHPYGGTKTHERGGFFIHGGKYRGSSGCIDLTNHMDRFVKNMRSEIGSNPNCYITLDVKYDKTKVIETMPIPTSELKSKKQALIL